MASILPNGKNYFADSNGAPLVGGKVYTYVPGTSTPKATHSDSGATVANTNPVILNSRGEALIYWTGSYDVTLKDSSDVTIWGPIRTNETEVAGAAASLESNIASASSQSNGAGQVGFDWLDYAYKTVGAALKAGFIDPKWLMPQAALDDVEAFTGLVDVTSYVQQAMTIARQASALGLNIGVRCGYGLYSVTDLFFSPSTAGAENHAPAYLVGQGQRGTVFKARAGTTTVIHSKNVTLRKFADFWVDCNHIAATGIDTDWDVSGGPSLNNTYQNIRVENYTGTGWKALNNNDCLFQKVAVVNPHASGLTAIDINGAGGMVALDSVTTIGGYLDVGGQDIHLGQGCVTQGIRLKYAGRNSLQIIGGYHYANASNSCIVEIATGMQSDCVTIDGHLEAPGTGYSVIGGAGAVLSYIQVSGTIDWSSGGSGSIRLLGASLTNSTGSLRLQVGVKISATAPIDWTADPAKFHVVNHECIVQGVRPDDAACTGQNSWVADTVYEATGWRVRYLEGSRMHIFGSIKSGTMTANTTVATVPTGKAPLRQKLLTGMSTTGPIVMLLDTSGNIKIVPALGGNSYLGIDAVVELET